MRLLMNADMYRYISIYIYMNIYDIFVVYIYKYISVGMQMYCIYTSKDVQCNVYVYMYRCTWYYLLHVYLQVAIANQ